MEIAKERGVDCMYLFSLFMHSLSWMFVDALKYLLTYKRWRGEERHCVIFIVYYNYVEGKIFSFFHLSPHTEYIRDLDGTLIKIVI